MRLFGSDRIARMMDRMGIQEGEAIQAGMMSKAVERAQKKVEENNFGIRKRLLEYDDVMNSQREVIYTRRRHALYGERIEIDLNNLMYDFAEAFVGDHQDYAFDEFSFELIREVGLNPSFDEAAYGKANRAELVELIVADLQAHYERRMKTIADVVRPVMQKVYLRMLGGFFKVMHIFRLAAVVHKDDIRKTVFQKTVDHGGQFFVGVQRRQDHAYLG